MRTVVAICGLIGTAALPVAGPEPLTIAVWPAFAIAPATVTVRSRIEPNADNRSLVIVADGPELYRSSEIQLDGARAPKTFELSFHEMPGGEYEVYVILIDSAGRRRATAHRAAKVISQSDGQ